MLSKNLEPIIKPKNSKRPWIIVAIVALFIVICSVLFVLWYRGQVNTPNKGKSTETVFIISKGQGLEAISKNLHNDNLISSPFAFQLYMKAAGQSKKIQAGEYKIPGNLNMKDLAQIITYGKIVTTKITIPEGWDIDKIGTYLEAHTIIKKADFESAAVYNSSTQKYSFLAGMKKGDSLEGFLYPDTYMLTLKPTANDVVSKMLANFDDKLTTADRAGIVKSGMTTREVVTLASIVEAEVAGTTDRKMVASVFLNRLNAGMPLESDATVAYSLKSGARRLTYEEVHTPTPYNTYLTAGLPKGPIGNPSIQSIEAVIFPAKSDYFYFISVKDKTYFARTLAEHNALVAKYLD
jgi:UPF0755 protein